MQNIKLRKRLKNPKPQQSPQNLHVHSLTEINVLWEYKSKYVKNATQNDIVRFFALGKKAACGVSGSREMLCFRICPLPVKSWQFVALDSIVRCRGEMVGQ